MGDGRAFDGMAPGPSGEIPPARASCVISLGILCGRAVEAICGVPRRRPPSESAGGGNNTSLAGPRGDRSLSKRHEAGRHIGRVDRIHRRQEQFNRHAKSVCHLSIYRQFRADLKNTAVLQRLAAIVQADAANFYYRQSRSLGTGRNRPSEIDSTRLTGLVAY
jgi:hypothetical protein